MVCEGCMALAGKLRRLRQHLIKGSDSEPLECLDEVCQLLSLNLYEDERDACHCAPQDGPSHTCGRLGPGDRTEVAIQVDSVELEAGQQLLLEEEGEEDMCVIDVDTARSITFHGWLQASARARPHAEEPAGGGAQGLLDGGLSGMLVPLRLFERYLSHSSQGEAATGKAGGAGGAGGAAHGGAGEKDEQAQRRIDLRGPLLEPQGGGRAEGPKGTHGQMGSDEDDEAGFWVEANSLVRQLMAKGAGDAEILARLRRMHGGSRIQPALLQRMRGLTSTPPVEPAATWGWSVQGRAPPTPLEQEDVVMASLRYVQPTYSIDATGAGGDTSGSTDTATASPCSDCSRSPLLEPASPPDLPVLHIESDSDDRSGFDTERARFSQNSNSSPSDPGSNSPGSPWRHSLKEPIEIAHIVL